MKVKELKHILGQLDPNDEVVLAGDPEGNYYRAADGYSMGWWNQTQQKLWDEKERPHALVPVSKAVVLWP